jgi:hypothetical protein
MFFNMAIPFILRKMNKKQCIRDAPCCWIPSSVSTLASMTAPPSFAPPPIAPPLFAPPTEPAAPPAWGWTPGSEAVVAAAAPPSPRSMERNEQLRRLEATRVESLKFRDRKFPSAGLLREDGGMFKVLENSIRSGRSWL